MKAELNFIHKIKKLVASKNFQKRHNLDPERFFTRQRKIGFKEAVYYIIGNTRCPAELEAEHFSQFIPENVSDTALWKARCKISSGAIKELFEETAKTIPQERCFHGYKIIAVDGMKGELPSVPELASLYPNANGHGAIFHAVSAYDSMNGVWLDSIFRFGISDERKLALELLEKQCDKQEESTKKCIFVYDRGFPSISFISEHIKKQQKFVMRVQASFMKEIEGFRKSKYNDKEVSILFDKSRRGIMSKDDEFSIRCVRIMLKSGQEEILITNVAKSEFPKRWIRDIYRLRWEIETGHGFLKDAIFVEEFTSKGENGIQQDYYASLLLANLVNCSCSSVYADIVKKTLRIWKEDEAQI